jgi:hypothetical protein
MASVDHNSVNIAVLYCGLLDHEDLNFPLY